MAKSKKKPLPKIAAKQNANVGSGPKITSKAELSMAKKAKKRKAGRAK